MMLRKYISDELKEQTLNIQVRVPLKLAKGLKHYKKESGLSWSKLITGLMRAFNDEIKGNRKKQ